MKEPISVGKFVFKPGDLMEWMSLEETAGLENIIFRAECYGGEGDIFLFCMEEKNVLCRVERNPESKTVQLFGMAFPPSERRIWYYIPELISLLLQSVEKRSRFARKKPSVGENRNCNEEKTARIMPSKLKINEALWKRQPQGFQEAVERFQQKNGNTLFPHTISFTRLNPDLYMEDGIDYYEYQDGEEEGADGVKELACDTRNPSRSALYLKPHKIFRSWTLSDGKRKVKIRDMEYPQLWNEFRDYLTERFADEWGI